VTDDDREDIWPEASPSAGWRAVYECMGVEQSDER